MLEMEIRLETERTSTVDTAIFPAVSFLWVGVSCLVREACALSRLSRGPMVRDASVFAPACRGQLGRWACLLRDCLAGSRSWES